MWNKFKLIWKNVLLIVAIAVVLLSINFSLNLKPSKAQQDVKWEYKGVFSMRMDSGNYICLTNGGIKEFGNKYGKDGWELVLYHDVKTDDSLNLSGCQEAVFKRRLVQSR